VGRNVGRNKKSPEGRMNKRGLAEAVSYEHKSVKYFYSEKFELNQQLIHKNSLPLFITYR
jgi:hypothetical protein